MALAMYFAPGAFTPERYDETINRLEAAGHGAPAGRLYHVAFEAGGLIQVVDVWESPGSRSRFSGRRWCRS